jgi:hypothetical protein
MAVTRFAVLLSLGLGALAMPHHDQKSTEMKSNEDPKNVVLPAALLARAPTTCKDNLGRCFNPTGTKPTDIASRASATAFCSSFLSLPIVTSTIATTTPAT